MLRASYPPSSLHCIRCIGESATVEVAESDTPMADAETISKLHIHAIYDNGKSEKDPNYNLFR